MPWAAAISQGHFIITESGLELVTAATQEVRECMCAVRTVAV